MDFAELIPYFQGKHMIIGLAGKMGAGKDHIGAIIEKEWDFQVVKFADPLKRVANELIEDADFFSEHTKDRFFPQIGMTGREFLQRLGTDVVRNIHPDIWVNALMGWYAPYENWVVTDVRFLNEVAAIKKAGGVVLVIEPPLSNKKTGAETLHNSETQLDNLLLPRIRNYQKECRYCHATEVDLINQLRPYIESYGY